MQDTSLYGTLIRHSIIKLSAQNTQIINIEKVPLTRMPQLKMTVIRGD